MKRLILSTFMMLVICAVQAQHSDIFAPNGKAIKGYDVVAFFKQAKAVPGTDTLTYRYKGAEWLFSSRENLEAFKSTPEKYSPEYGGYCAYGMAEGHKAPTEAETWTIINNKLYFNYNQKVKTLWTKDNSTLIEKANSQWPLMRDKE